MESSVAAAVAKRAARHGDDAAPIYVLSRTMRTVAELWDEYTVSGIPNGPPVKDLVANYGTKWRSYDGGKEEFAWHSHVYEEIERLIEGGADAETAVKTLQEELDSYKKDSTGGRGRKPTVSSQWRQLATRIRHAHPRPAGVRGRASGHLSPDRPLEDAPEPPGASSWA